MKQFKLTKVVSIFLLCFLMTGIAAFAEGGDGGGSNPLTLDSIGVENGLDAVGVNEVIYLNFSNNVVNLSVKDANAACFSLVDSSGARANFLTMFGDDQVNRETRNTIEIRPFGGWTPGETYTLNISKDLASKNGSTLGEDTQVTFTIVSEEEAAAAAAETTDATATDPAAETTDATATDASAETTDATAADTAVETTDATAADTAVETTDTTAADTAVETTDTTAADTAAQTDSGNTKKTVLVALVVLIAAGGIFWVVKSK
jgi:hypothetical protein